MKNPLDALHENGYVIIPEIYSPEEISSITKLISDVHGEHELFGERQFLQRTPGLLDLLLNEALRKLLAEVAPGYFIIKSTYYDKPPQLNWFVSWHQDKIIFVKEKLDTFGFKTWTKKDNEYGVQPPAEYLGNIITLRIHLDDATATNGALKVIPHSHSEASVRSVDTSFTDEDSVLCEVSAGGVMLMKPLLFHSSSRATSENPRRVIHVELCSLELPEGMEWAQKMAF